MKGTIRRAVLVGLLATLAACGSDGRQAVGPTTPSAAATRRESYLAVSDTAVSPGTVLTVSANVDTASGGERIASYLARLRFDPHQLAYVSEEPIAGVLSAVNASAGEVVVAGASATGLPGARLFVLHFRALAKVDAPALSLEIDQLNTVSYASRTRQIVRVPEVRFDRLLR